MRSAFAAVPAAILCGDDERAEEERAVNQGFGLELMDQGVQRVRMETFRGGSL
jgi:hypothetical protein